MIARSYIDYPPPQGRPVAAHFSNRPPPPVSLQHPDWPGFWREATASLRQCGFQTSTLIFYRHILRHFARFTDKPPHAITPRDIKEYLRSLTRQPVSWHWTGMNISVLRTLFDKLGGLNALVHQRGPRRKRTLPEILSRDDLQRLFAHATTLRDQLILALFYGCGLKTGELQTLRWREIDPDAGHLQLPARYSGKIRTIKLPEATLSLLRLGKTQCTPDDLLFPGTHPVRGLTPRAVQTLLRNIAKQAGLNRPVTPMVLRHTFAVHFLEDGGTIRQLQEILGHETLEPTMRYQALVRDQSNHPILEPLITLHTEPEILAAPIFPLVEKAAPRFADRLRQQLKIRKRGQSAHINIWFLRALCFCC